MRTGAGPSPLGAFGVQKGPGLWVANATVLEQRGVGSPEGCAERCLAQPACVSFNFLPGFAPAGSAALCVLNGYGAHYHVCAAQTEGPLCALEPGRCYDSAADVAVLEANGTAACCAACSAADGLATGADTHGSGACVGWSLAGGKCSLKRYLLHPVPCGGVSGRVRQRNSDDSDILYCNASGNAPALHANSSYFMRTLARNDEPQVQAVPYALGVPTGGVRLGPGPLRTAFENNLIYLLGYRPDDVLYWFRVRANQSNPGRKPAPEAGGNPSLWGSRLKGHVAGLVLMGTGGASRWLDAADGGNGSKIRAMMDAVVSGVKAAADPDGYIMAFPRWAMDRDEDPDYVVRHNPLPIDRNSVRAS